MTGPVFRDVERAMLALRHHLPHHHYDSANTIPEVPVSLIDTIEQALTAAGHTIDQAAHDVLTRHLTLPNIAAHVAQGIADVQASPVAQALERAALGPAGEAFAARLIDDAAGFFQAQAAPAAALADAEPPPAQ